MSSIGVSRLIKGMASLRTPPFHLGAAFSGGGTTASEIHRACARLALRGRVPGAPSRSQLLLRAALWPATASILAIHSALRHGGLVRARSGKGRLRQLREMIVLALANSIPPRSYTRLDLYVPENLERAGLYLHRFETKGILFPVINEHRGDIATLLLDKRHFEARCRAHGVPTPIIVARAEGGRVECDEPPGRLLRRGSWIVKPACGKGGRGIERWDLTPEGGHRSGEGHRLSTRELVAHLRRTSRQAPLVIQPRLTNHPDLGALSPGALSTTRIVTVRNEEGRFEVVAAALRMAVSSATVDNLHRGGIAASVDLDSGELGSAVGLTADSLRTLEHPTTGARITGRKLPHWSQVRELVERAHQAFPELVIIAWDVAVTRSGPVIIEANHNPGVDALQRPAATPLGASRFAELIAHHLREIESERCRERWGHRLSAAPVRWTRELTEALAPLVRRRASPPDALVVSFPKCGRTWLRVQLGRVLQQHFGLEVDDLIGLEARAELDSRVPRIRVKHIDKPQHRTPLELSFRLARRARRSKVIFLTRDPRDAVVSTYMQKTRRGMKPYFEGTLSEFIREPVGSFETLLRYYHIWTANSVDDPNFLLVRYEDMHSDPVGQLRRVLDFIGLSEVDDASIAEAVAFSAFDRMRDMERSNQMKNHRLHPGDPNDAESFKTRKGRVGGYLDYLSASDIEHLNRRMRASASALYTP